LTAIALKEAMRPIAVREGDKITKMPAVQALIRSMFRNAAQGDAKSQRQLLDMVAQKESARITFTREVLEGAVRYKEETGAIFARHERDGLPPPQIYPHPDDVIINLGTGEVTIDGPMSKEQAGAQKVVMGDTMKNVMRISRLKRHLLTIRPIGSCDAKSRNLTKSCHFMRGTPKEEPGVRRSGRHARPCKTI
jgi:hypothetical protein